VKIKSETKGKPWYWLTLKQHVLKAGTPERRNARMPEYLNPERRNTKSQPRSQDFFPFLNPEGRNT